MEHFFLCDQDDGQRVAQGLGLSRKQPWGRLEKVPGLE
jgi:hypothetical protein